MQAPTTAIEEPCRYDALGLNLARSPALLRRMTHLNTIDALEFLY